MIAFTHGCPELGLEAQKTGIDLMTVVAWASYSLVSWPRSFWYAAEMLRCINTEDMVFLFDV